jgi:hypothetical protein
LVRRDLQLIDERIFEAEDPSRINDGYQNSLIMFTLFNLNIGFIISVTHQCSEGLFEHSIAHEAHSVRQRQRKTLIHVNSKGIVNFPWTKSKAFRPRNHSPIISRVCPPPCSPVQRQTHGSETREMQDSAGQRARPRSSRSARAVGSTWPSRSPWPTQWTKKALVMRTRTRVSSMARELVGHQPAHPERVGSIFGVHALVIYMVCTLNPNHSSKI